MPDAGHPAGEVEMRRISGLGSFACPGEQR